MVHDVSVCRRAFELVSVKYQAPQLHVWQTFAAHRPGLLQLLALQYLSAYSIGVGSGGRHSPSQSSCTGPKTKRSGTWVGNGHSHK